MSSRRVGGASASKSRSDSPGDLDGGFRDGRTASVRELVDVRQLLRLHERHSRDCPSDRWAARALPMQPRGSADTELAAAKDEEEKSRVGRRARPPTLLQLVQRGGRR
jgi:hypothetical protein